MSTKFTGSDCICEAGRRTKKRASNSEWEESTYTFYLCKKIFAYCFLHSSGLSYSNYMVVILQL